MAHGPLIRENLVVISSRETLVAEEVNSLVLDAGNVFLGLDVLQAVGLVPASREDIEGDLSSDRVPVSLLLSGTCQKKIANHLR